MSDHQSRQKESLSKMMDTVADDLELHRTLKAVGDDPEIRASWGRYHLVRSTIRNELPDYPVDLSASISAAIREEPEHKASMGISTAWRSFGRVAIAASVTVMAVLGVQQFNLSDAEPAGSGSNSQIIVAATEQTDRPELTMPSGFQVPPLVTRNVSSDNSTMVHNQSRPVVLMNQPPMDQRTRKQIEAYINVMMKRHTEYSIEEGSHSLLPYARLPQESAE